MGVEGSELASTYQFWYIEVQPEKHVEVVFFGTPGGKQPVRDWLKLLPVEDRKTIGRDLQTVEFSWPVGMPLCRPMGGGLHELRSSLNKRMARVFFIIYGEQMVLLHAFMKKSQATPKTDLNLALERKRLVENG